MNLVYFLTVGAIFSATLGEFVKYPFGANSQSISLLDLNLALILLFYSIWQIGIKREILLPKYLEILAIFWLVGLIGFFFYQDFSGVLYLLRFILYSLTLMVGSSLAKAGFK